YEDDNVYCFENYLDNAYFDGADGPGCDLEGDCAELNSSSLCEANELCFWDNLYDECYADFFDFCSDLINESDCLSEGGCEWDSGLEECFSDFEPCYLNEDSFECNNHDGCFWDGSLDECVGNAGGEYSVCFDYDATNQTACESAFGGICIWDREESLCDPSMTCDYDEVCDVGEDYFNCPNDCGQDTGDDCSYGSEEDCWNNGCEWDYEEDECYSYGGDYEDIGECSDNVNLTLDGNILTTGKSSITGTIIELKSLCGGFYDGLSDRDGYYSISVPSGDFNVMIYENTWPDSDYTAIEVKDENVLSIDGDLTVNATLYQIDVDVDLTDLENSEYQVASGSDLSFPITITNNEDTNLNNWMAIFKLVQYNPISDKEIVIYRVSQLVNITSRGGSYENIINVTLPSEVRGPVNLRLGIAKSGKINVGDERITALTYKFVDEGFYVDDGGFSCDYNGICEGIENLMTCPIDCVDESQEDDLSLTAYFNLLDADSQLIDEAMLCIGNPKEHECNDVISGVTRFTMLSKPFQYGMYADTYDETSDSFSFIELFDGFQLLELDSGKNATINVTLYDEISLDVDFIGAEDYQSMVGIDENVETNTNVSGVEENYDDIVETDFNFDKMKNYEIGEDIIVNITVTNRHTVDLTDWRVVMKLEPFQGFTDELRNFTSIDVSAGETESVILIIEAPDVEGYGEAGVSIEISKFDEFVTTSNKDDNLLNARTGTKTFNFLRITPDFEGPEIEINSPDTEFQSGTVNLDIFVNDSSDFEWRYEIHGYDFENNLPYENISEDMIQTVLLEDIPFNSGKYELIVIAEDENGNVNHDFTYFFVDALAPELEVIYPENNSIVSPGKYIEIHAFDFNRSSVISYDKGDGEQILSGRGFNRIDTSDWADDTYQVEINARDFDKVNSTVFWITIQNDSNVFFDSASDEADRFNDKINNLLTSFNSSTSLTDSEQEVIENLNILNDLSNKSTDLVNLKSLIDGVKDGGLSESEKLELIQNYTNEIENIKNNTVGELKVNSRSTFVQEVNKSITQREIDAVLDTVNDSSTSVQDNTNISASANVVTVTYLSGREETKTVLGKDVNTVGSNSDLDLIGTGQGMSYSVSGNVDVDKVSDTKTVVSTKDGVVYFVEVIDKNLTGENSLNASDIEFEDVEINGVDVNFSVVEEDPIVKWSFSESSSTESTSSSSGDTTTTTDSPIIVIPEQNTFTHLWEQISPDSISTFNIGEDALFNKIVFGVNSIVTNVKLVVNEDAELPGNIDSPNNEVYKYIEIVEHNIVNSEFEFAKITFKANKDWVNDNGGKDNVILMRYDDGWTVLNTEYDSTENDDYVYSADSPGLSYFAIGAEKVKGVESEGSESEESGSDESVESSVEYLEGEEVITVENGENGPSGITGMVAGDGDMQVKIPVGIIVVIFLILTGLIGFYAYERLKKGD
ncbi:PGF-pre-PGF domain-containing protein, partial [Nanoarchaeota archaeon]